MESTCRWKRGTGGWLPSSWILTFCYIRSHRNICLDYIIGERFQLPISLLRKSFYVAPSSFIPPNFFDQSRNQGRVKIYSALYINPDCNLLGSFELLLITIYSGRYLFRQVSTATQKCMKKYEKTSDYYFSQLRISSTMFFKKNFMV